MRWLIERWLSGPGWRRVAMITVVTGLVTVVAWMSLIRPHHSHFSQLEVDNKQTTQRIAELQRKVLQVLPLNCTCVHLIYGHFPWRSSLENRGGSC